MFAFWLLWMFTRSADDGLPLAVFSAMVKLGEYTETSPRTERFVPALSCHSLRFHVQSVQQATHRIQKGGLASTSTYSG
eukprot:2625410-Amphidinium_carterae.2